jgi:hypothetical protein
MGSTETSIEPNCHTSIYQSGGHGIIPIVFREGRRRRAVAPKVAETSRVATLWVLMVIAGCCGLLGIGFSTVSAQPPPQRVVTAGGAQADVHAPELLEEPMVGGASPASPHQLGSAGQSTESGRAGREGRPNTTRPFRFSFRLRIPIELPPRRRLRICSVARFSRDEQRRQSISAQHRHNRAFVELLDITDYDWFEIQDEGVSGEIKDRPGIARLREGIAAREWDLILCEDSSPIYRNLEACVELVALAVDISCG